MLQHFLNFLPNLFGIASAGTASVGYRTGLGHSYPSQLLGPFLPVTASSAIIRPAFLQCRKVPDTCLLLMRGLLITRFVYSILFDIVPNPLDST
jgi:hypothetical protein